MPHPFYIREPDKDLSPKVDRKSEITVGTMIRNIFINIKDIVMMLAKWR
tara:strand:+ start:1172 stop:1318 length:147 start_codon:yes stop_codon:yes gene_type:complete